MRQRQRRQQQQTKKDTSIQELEPFEMLAISIYKYITAMLYTQSETINVKCDLHVQMHKRHTNTEQFRRVFDHPKYENETKTIYACANMYGFIYR